LKEASEILNINYSTAKTIIRVYRKENRIFKKSYIKDNNSNHSQTNNSISNKKILSTLENSEEDIIKREEKEKSSITNFNNQNYNNNFMLNQLNNQNNLNTEEVDKNSILSSPNKFLGRKINRDIESCHKMLNDVYHQIIINRNMLQNLFFISHAINKSADFNFYNY
jgi:hypothetical protein